MPYAFGGRPLRPDMVPTRPVRRIEGHPLAFNEGWIPGGQRGFAPLVGPGGALKPIGGPIAGSPFGPGFLVNAFNQYATGPSVGLALQPSAGMSLVWAGAALGADDLNFSTIFGAYYSATEAAPYYNCVLKRNGALAFESNVAGTRYTITTTTDLATGVSSVVVLTADFTSGVQNIYLNGILIGTQTVPAGSPSYSGPPAFSFSDPVFHTDRYPNTVSAAGYVYNFALSAEAIQGVTTEPFGMLDEGDETPRLWFPVSSGIGIALYGRSAIKVAAAAPLSGAAALAARGEVAAREKAAAAGLVGLLARGEIATKEKASATGSVALAASTGIATKAQGAAAGDAPLSGRVTIATTARAAPSGAAGLIALLGRAGVAVQGATRLQGTVPLAARTSAVTAMHAAIAPALFLKAWAAIGAKAKGAATLPLALAARASIAAAIRSQPSGSLPLRAFAWVVAKARALLGTGPQVTTDFGDIVVFGPVFDSVAFAATIDTVEF